MTDEQEIYEAAQRYRMWPMTDLAGVMEAYKDLLETIRAKQSPQPMSGKTMAGLPITYWILAIVQLFAMAEDGEDIPLNALFGMKGEVTQDDLNWATQQIAELKKVGRLPVGERRDGD